MHPYDLLKAERDRERKRVRETQANTDPSGHLFMCALNGDPLGEIGGHLEHSHGLSKGAKHHDAKNNSHKKAL